MACTFYEYRSGLFSGDYWCRKNDCPVDENTYYRYCRNYSYDECPIYKHQESSGCFITTVACQILGKEDQDPILNDLRNFRSNVLQKDEKYYDILKEYDVIGPMVADALVNDKDRDKIASVLYQDVILPVHLLIQKSDYEKAVESYYVMTLMLVNYYGLKHEYNDLKDKNYGYSSVEFDPAYAGHGRRRIKEKDV